jgi:hypothetical protein
MPQEFATRISSTTSEVFEQRASKINTHPRDVFARRCLRLSDFEHHAHQMRER